MAHRDVTELVHRGCRSVDEAGVARVLVVTAIGTVWFDTRRKQWWAYGLLVAGGVSHLVLDGLTLWADGYSGAYLYPVTWWRAPAPGWYGLADRWTVLVFLLTAVCVALGDRYCTE